MLLPDTGPVLRLESLLFSLLKAREWLCCGAIARVFTPVGQLLRARLHGKF